MIAFHCIKKNQRQKDMITRSYYIVKFNQSAFIKPFQGCKNRVREDWIQYKRIKDSGSKTNLIRKPKKLCGDSRRDEA